jgi:hypothetical protein
MFCVKNRIWNPYGVILKSKSIIIIIITITIMTIIFIIKKYQEKSLEVFELFEKNVLNKNYSPGEADIILSTIHAAKGTYKGGGSSI